MIGHQVKCLNCNEWTSGKKKHCESCGSLTKQPEEKNSKRLEDPLKLQFIKINKDDGSLVILGKRIVQFGQLILYAIISFLVWISSVTVG